MACYLLRAKYAQDSMNAPVQRPEDRMLTTTRLFKEVHWQSPQGASACASVRALWRIMSTYVGAGPSGPESAPG